MTPEPQDQPISPYLNAARQEFKRPKVDRQKLWGVPSKPEDSLVLRAIRQDGRLRMPPD